MQAPTAKPLSLWSLGKKKKSNGLAFVSVTSEGCTTCWGAEAQRETTEPRAGVTRVPAPARSITSHLSAGPSPPLKTREVARTPQGFREDGVNTLCKV